MPEKYPSFRGVPRLSDVAEMGMLIVAHCNLCRRGMAFLATDLCKVCDPTKRANEPQFGCGRCGQVEYVSWRYRVPALEEYGRLPIRRPVRQVWKWRTEMLAERR